jgi:hypothetical protein
MDADYNTPCVAGRRADLPLNDVLDAQWSLEFYFVWNTFTVHVQFVWKQNS